MATFLTFSWQRVSRGRPCFLRDPASTQTCRWEFAPEPREFFRPVKLLCRDMPVGRPLPRKKLCSDGIKILSLLAISAADFEVNDGLSHGDAPCAPVKPARCSECKSHTNVNATHVGPESCGAARKSGVEALTGGRAGRVFSRERHLLRDADAVRRSGRLHRVATVFDGEPHARELYWDEVSVSGRFG
jgi:hypothetical protein